MAQQKLRAPWALVAALMAIPLNGCSNCRTEPALLLRSTTGSDRLTNFPIFLATIEGAELRINCDLE